MLKIKDNVNLKELEKYGFKKSSIYSSASYNKDLEDGDTLSVIIDDRKLFLDTWEYSDNYLLEVAKDLIKADLVEKVIVMNKEEIKAQWKLGFVLGLFMILPTLIFIICCWFIKG